MIRNKTQAQVFYLKEDSLLFRTLPEKIEVQFTTSPFFTERILFNKNRAECEGRKLATSSWASIDKELPTDNRGYTFGVNCLG